MSKSFFDYYQKLLLAQYDVSEQFVHNPTMGSIREDFLKKLITNRHKNITVKSGELFNDSNNHSPQCDSIFCLNSAPMDPPNSENIMLHIKYCKLVLEIKSRLSYDHLKKSNKDATKIKNLDIRYKPLCGIFAYHLDLNKNNLLKRFGYKYDEDLDSYEFDENLKIYYPNLDFIMCISTENEADLQFFITKNQNDNRFYLNYEKPVIKHLFTIAESLKS